MGTSFRRPAGEILPGREFVQVFRVISSDLSAVHPILATYARPVAGTIELALFHIPPDTLSRKRWFWDDPASMQRNIPLRKLRRFLRKPISSLKITGKQVIDNDVVDLLMPDAAVSAGDLLALRIKTSGVDAHNAPTVWTSSGPDRIPGHVACYFDGKDLENYGVSATLSHCPLDPISNIPPAILYSPISQCNLNCVHCISRDTRQSVNVLPAKIKENIRKWASDGKLTSMNTDYSGDILWVDEQFGGELDFIFDLNIPYQVDTNGVCLTSEVAYRLCRSKILGVNISLDAASDATYRRVRRGAPSLNSVLSNVESLIGIRNSLGANFRITLGFTLMMSTISEWNEFIKLADKLGVDAINTAHIHAYTNDMEPESLWHEPDEFNAARLQAIALANSVGLAMGVPPPFHGVPEVGHAFCAEPWKSASVLGNGDVAACCVPGTVMGNLHKESMEEIWTGPHYRNLRAKVNSSSPPAPCSICPMFRRVGNRGSYLQHSARQLEPSQLSHGQASADMLKSQLTASTLGIN